MDVLNAIQKALRSCTKIINQLLVLASVDQTKQDGYNASEIELSELIIAVIEEMAPLAQQKNIELGVAAPERKNHRLNHRISAARTTR
ncbi:MAG: HAMP domain-containing histidine kinase, partial [Deltaproteobacteria bacterium]|nr:HAMP domain-containing histidine kinase [Deltaproteobacteria bacterium]